MKTLRVQRLKQRLNQELPPSKYGPSEHYEEPPSVKATQLFKQKAMLKRSKKSESQLTIDQKMDKYLLLAQKRTKVK